VIPIGGGGLVAGVALAVHHSRPQVEVIGVQSEHFPAMQRAFAGLAGAVPSAPTIAEGIAVDQPGRLTLPLVREHVKRIDLVSEAQLERAIVMLLEIEKTVVEGAGAAGLAAVLAQPQLFAGRKVGLILCGGNIDSLIFSDIIQRSLVRAHRLARLSVRARDVPGSLARIATLVAEQGANIEEVTHQRAFADLPVHYARIELVMSTRGQEHLDVVIAALAAAGYPVTLRDG
jgi:threonine dehydratase